MKDSIYTNGEYFRENPTLASEHSPWKAGKIALMLQRNNITDFNTVAEIGCGGGRVLYELAGKYYSDKEFFGYDISPEAISVCRKLAGDKMHFILGGVEQMSCENDIILCIDVVEHIEDSFSFLRALKMKGQYKIFHIPLEMSVWNVIRYNSFLMVRKTLGHVCHYSRETALALLSDCDYEIVDCFYTRGSLEIEQYSGLRHRVLNMLRRATECFSQSMSARLWGGYSLMILAR